MKPTAPNSSGRHISGRCLCGAVELQIDFPAFWACGAAYATYIARAPPRDVEDVEFVDRRVPSARA
jgi:hypothetical protein